MLVDLWSERVRLPAGSMSCFLKHQGVGGWAERVEGGGARRPALHPFNPERPEGGQSPPSAPQHLLAQDSFLKTEPAGLVHFMLAALCCFSMHFRTHTEKETFIVSFPCFTHFRSLLFVLGWFFLFFVFFLNHPQKLSRSHKIHVCPVVPQPAEKQNVQSHASC